MILANYTENGEKTAGLFRRMKDLPIDAENVLKLAVSGRTYQEKKNALRDLAIEYSGMDTSGLSWAEVGAIKDFFAAAGRRFGLLSEFKENCIC
ncbi:MAG: hypothetical protein IIZ93_16105 [Acidaminococcaceae bacterium]|nr:hypothetical protein [Acidaminococcaceae bacterium]